MNIFNCSCKRDGFLLIEVLVALAIFVLMVKAALLLHVSLITMQKSVSNRMQALERSCMSIEVAKGGALLQDLRPCASHDHDNTNRFMTGHETVPITFFVSGEKSTMKLTKDNNQIVLPCACVTTKWDSLCNKGQSLMLMNG